MVFVGVLVCLINQNWSELGVELFATLVGTLVGLGVLSLVQVAALCLAGFHCRRRYHPARLLLWPALWVVTGLGLALLPFAAVGMVSEGAEVAVAFAGFVLVGAGVAYALMLPFLVLAAASPFYRERLRTLLRMGVIPPQPLSIPPELTPAPTG
jgi:hypothetical protein